VPVVTAVELIIYGVIAAGSAIASGAMGAAETRRAAGEAKQLSSEEQDRQDIVDQRNQKAQRRTLGLENEAINAQKQALTVAAAKEEKAQKKAERDRMANKIATLANEQAAFGQTVRSMYNRR